MSRRKQEKPQPRKNLVKGESDSSVPDILTCGVCRKNFPLADIVRFIQHKVQTCNKENSCGLGLVYNEDSEEDSAPLLLPKKEVEEDEAPAKEEPVSSSSIIKMALTAKDASANTQECHEPRSYVCSTCKLSLSTAWALIQHVQAAHGLSICAQADSTSTDDRPCQDALGLRVPLLERQMEPLPLYAPPRISSHQEQLHLAGGSPCVTPPPPLLEPPKISSFQDSSYSQRLRVLAGATSPNAASTPRKLLQSGFKAALSNGGSPGATAAHLPADRASLMNTSSASSTTSETNPPTTTTNNNNNNNNNSGSNGVGPKSGRLCEYCGKSFQFKSNLIVHRRSHTGEKPFKCRVCSHACTQASKLKRHMKTHRKKKQEQQEAPLQNGDAKTNGDCGSDKEEEEEHPEDEDAEEEEGEDEEEAELNVDGLDEEEEEEEDALRENGKLVIIDPHDEDMVAEDLTKKPSKRGEEGPRKPQQLQKHSVISEIMEKIGFGRIPPYNEAYRQALKESSSLRKQDRCSSGTEASNDAGSLHSYDVLSSFGSNHSERREGSRSAGQSPLNFSAGLMDSFEQQAKRMRVEDHPGAPHKDRDGSFLYAGVWYPRVETASQYRDLFGLDATSKSESALSVARPGPSSLLGGGAKSSPNSSSKEAGGVGRRNDTCEYCGKVFKNCSNLTVHRRSHTGEKPYKCELCSYACAQSSKLTRHMKTHGRLGKDVYRCRFCDMPFSVASTLEKHMRKCVVSQSGGSPYLVSEDSKEMAAA